MSRPSIDSVLAQDAAFLRPARIINDDLRHYTPTAFENGRSGIERMLRILNATGHLMGYPEEGGRGDIWVDVLDDKGDILQEWPIDRRGFNFMRSRLGFKVEK